MRDPTARLRDILDAIQAIERFVAEGQHAYEQDERLQIWFLHHVRIIGEAARALPSEVREQAPSVPWSSIVGLRNVIVHHYFGIDLGVLWDVVTDDFPPLKQEIESLLRKLDP